MNGAGNFFVRWRVRLGYPLANCGLYFSLPHTSQHLVGALAVSLVLWVRRMQPAIFTSKKSSPSLVPMLTRNPALFGSGILALGAGIARARGLPP